MIGLLDKIPAGTVRTYLCEDVSDVVATLSDPPELPSVNQRIVTVTWDKLPAIESLIDDTLKAMAEVALRLWPAWYDSAPNVSDVTDEHGQSLIRGILDKARLTRARQEVSSGWLKSAVRSVNVGKRPLPEGFSRALQASQLALVIQPDELFIVLAAADAHPAKEMLMGLAKTAEWLAGETNGRLAVLIPRALSKHEELDSILYGADVIASCALATSAQPQEEEGKHVVWPVIGQPHPFSPGEQELGRRLARDPDLGELFRFNQRVLMDAHNAYIVDLLWPDGKVVVEVDGYKHHSNHMASLLSG